MTHEEARERVSRGAALLDEKRPGWADEINNELEMTKCSRCVLGQLFGLFSDGARAIGVRVDYADHWAEAIRHGFYLEGNGDDDERNYVPLKEAWMDAIQERVAVPAVVWQHREKELVS